MKKLLALLLVMLLTVGSCGAESVGEIPYTLDDGTTGTIAEAMQGKDAAIVSFFTSWCMWCFEELPLLSEIQKLYGDRVAVFALDDYAPDTPETVAKIREKIGLDASLPMGVTAEALSWNMFGSNSYPFLVLIDRYGKACYRSSGFNTEMVEIIGQVLDPYLAEDYAQSVVTEEDNNAPSGSFIVVTDRASNRLIPGVKIKLCTDSACELRETDIVGVISVRRAPDTVYDCEILSVPDGYAMPAKTAFQLRGQNDYIQIHLSAKP